MRIATAPFCGIECATTYDYYDIYDTIFMFDLVPFSSLAVPTFLLTSLIATEHGAGLYTELSTVTSNSFLLEKASH